MVTMTKDFRSDIEIIIDGKPKKRPVKMKDTTFYNGLLPKCKKIAGGMYVAPSGRVVEFR